MSNNSQPTSPQKIHSAENFRRALERVRLLENALECSAIDKERGRLERAIADYLMREAFKRRH